MMIAWGTLSTCLLFVTHTYRDTTLRLFTGAAETRFFPGAVRISRSGSPAFRRGRIMALFMSAIPVSGCSAARSPADSQPLRRRPGGLARLAVDVPAARHSTVVLGALAYFLLSDSRQRQVADPAGAQCLRRIKLNPGEQAEDHVRLVARSVQESVWALA